MRDYGAPDRRKDQRELGYAALRLPEPKTHASAPHPESRRTTGRAMHLNVRDQGDHAESRCRGVTPRVPARAPVLDMVGVCIPAPPHQRPNACTTSVQDLPSRVHRVVSETRIGNGAGLRARLVTLARGDSGADRHHRRMAWFAAPPEGKQEISC